jgi:hypothetical protein
MKVRYLVTQDVRDVDDSVGRELIARNLAAAVEEVSVPAQKPAKRAKRRYQRRDMRAID